MRIALLFLLICFHLCFSPCFSAEIIPSELQNHSLSLSSSEKAWIRNHPVVTVGIGLNKLPYEADNKKHEGMIYDILSEVSKNTGIKFKYKESSFDQHLSGLKNGSIDIIPAIYKTQPRLSFINFTKPYYKSLDYIFVRKDLSVNNLQQLSSHKIAISKGHASLPELLKYFPRKNIVEVYDVNEAIDLVMNRQVDGLFDSYASIASTLEQEGVFNIKPFVRLPNSQAKAVRMGVSKNSPVLYSILNKGLESLSEQKLAVVHKRWSVSSAIENNPQTVQSQLSLTSEERDWIANHKIVRVAGDNGWAPFDFAVADGSHSGLSHDMLDNISLSTGIIFKYQTNDWSDTLNSIKTGEADLLPAVYKTKEREKYLAFSNPYYNSMNYFYARTKIGLHEYQELDSFRLAIVKDTAKVDRIRELFPSLRIIEYPTTSAAIDAVSKGSADLLYDSQAVITYWLNIKSIDNIVPFKPLPGDAVNALRFAVGKNNQILISILNKAIAAIPKKLIKSTFSRWNVGNALSTTPSFFLNNEEKKWLDNHRILSFSGDPSWMPYESVNDNGEYVGIVADYLKLIENSLQVEIDIKTNKTWSQTVSQFNSGELQIISISENYDGLKQAEFVQPYLSSPFVIVMREDHPYVEGISEVIEKKINLLMSYPSTNDLIKKYPLKKFDLVLTAQQGLENLYSGKTDVFVCSLAQANYLIKDQGYDNLRVVGKMDSLLKVGFAVRRKDKELVSILNKVLKSIPLVEKRTILSKWVEPEPVVRVDYLFAFQVAIVSIIIFSFIVYSNRKLRREIVLRASTERSLKQSERTLQSLIDNTPVIIFVTAKDTKELQMANPTACRELNLNPNNLSLIKGTDFYFWSKNDSEAKNVVAEFKETGRVNEQLVKLKSLSGNVIQGALSIIPLKFSGRDSYLNIVVNLNERIALENQLELAKNKAESANRAKSEFLANMSHEIRTPMNAIIGFTQLLHEQVKDAKLKSFVDTIKSAGNALLMLINDILDLSKIEAGKLSINLEVIDPEKVLENIASIFAMTAKNKDLDLILDVDPRIPHSLLIDSVRIRQVLFNLVGNAVKFTEKGFIKLRAVPENENLIASSVDLRIDVIDSGCGISEKDIDIIFENFEQQEGQDYRQFGGTGLGLTISRRLTELMGGELTVSSIQGEGSTFSFILKKVAVSTLKAVDFEHAGGGSEESTIFEDAKVLIVDDIENNRVLLKEIFDEVGLVSEQAVDGEEAVRMVKEGSFALVMMDIRMPKLDGYQAAEQIKASYSNLPVVALTASVIRDEYDAKRREIFDGYLRKPVLKQELIEELKLHLPHTIKPVLKGKDNRQPTNDLSLLSGAVRFILRQDYLPVCRELQLSNSLHDIEVFAIEMIELGEQQAQPILSKFAGTLKEATACFDIDQIKRLMSQFENTVSSFD